MSHGVCGLELDPIAAYAWYGIAILAPDCKGSFREGLIETRNEYERSLSDQQVEKGQELAERLLREIDM